MRIGLTGTSGTGKTTLAHKISEDYNKFLVTNVARNSPGARVKRINEKASVLNQLSILTTLAAWTEIPDIVSERTPLDALAYSYGVFDRDVWDMAVAITNSSMLNYDLIIYCPYYGWEIEKDPFRSDDKNYLRTIDGMIARYLYDIMPDDKVVTMGNIDSDERMKILAEFIH